MKFLIVFSCALAVATAGYANPYYYAAFQHVPVITPHGVPVETPEVQIAKINHLAAHAQVQLGAGHHHGVPADTPEVAAAKLAHLQTVAAKRAGYHVAPIAAASHVAPLVAAGHPIDTPEVQVAKAAHFAAHAAAHGHLRKRRALPYPLHYPVIDRNGVPVETPEVQAAKAHHFQEVARIAQRPGQNIPDAVDYNSHHYSAPQYHAPQYAATQYSAPQYTPAYYNHAPLRGPGGPPAQIGPDGQPLETPEVRAAKAAHFAAYAAVAQGNYGHFGR
nr:unnamed protein product [Callosobruchus chinensis]